MAVGPGYPPCARLAVGRPCFIEDYPAARPLAQIDAPDAASGRLAPSRHEEQLTGTAGSSAAGGRA